MKKWQESTITCIVGVIATAIGLAVCLGFYYIIMLLAKTVFF